MIYKIITLIVCSSLVFAEDTIDIDKFLDSIEVPVQKEVVCKDFVKTNVEYMQCLEEKTANDPTVENINFLAGVYVVKKQYNKALKTYKILMDKGDKDATYYYAAIINEEFKEHKKALPYFEKIKNFKDSTCQMGGIYSVPDKTDWREIYYKYVAKKRTLAFYDKEIKEGNTKAYGCKALYYEKLEEFDKAKEMINKAIELDDDKGKSYFQMAQHIVQYEYSRTNAVPWYEKSSSFGFAMAAHNLGVGYAKAKEYDKAVKWFIKAHELGYEKSLYDIGHAYALKPDFERAEKVWRKTGDMGDDRGYYNIGIMYREHKMYAKAEEKFLECFNEGHAVCGTAIGVFYEEVEGYQDLDKAMYYGKKAYEMGDFYAGTNIGMLYYSRDDIENAKKWFKIAADGGSGQGAYNMARMYHKDFKDYKNAKIWYERAAELGFPQAISILDGWSKS